MRLQALTDVTAARLLITAELGDIGLAGFAHTAKSTRAAAVRRLGERDA